MDEKEEKVMTVDHAPEAVVGRQPESPAGEHANGAGEHETQDVDEYADYLRGLGEEYPDMDMEDAEQRHKAVMERHKKMSDELDKHRSNNEKMNALFGENPNAGYFLNDMMSGMSREDLADSFLRNFGDDFKAALEDPTDENKEKFANAFKDYADRLKESEELQAQFEKNDAQTQNTISNWMAEKNIGSEQIDTIKERLVDMMTNFMQGIVTSEMLDAIYNSSRFDDAVAAAREEGLAEGRNEKIRHQTRQAKGDGMPIIEGGGGAKAGSKPKDTFLASAERTDPWEQATREKW